MIKALSAIINKPLKVSEKPLSVGAFAPPGKRAKEFVAMHKVQHNRYAVTDKDPRFDPDAIEASFAEKPSDPRLPSSVPVKHGFPEPKNGGNATSGRDIYPSGIAGNVAGVENNMNPDNLGEDDIDEKKKTFRDFVKGGKKLIHNLDNSEGSPLESTQFDEGHFEKMDDEHKHWKALASVHGKQANEHYDKATKAREAKREEQGDDYDYAPCAKEEHHTRMGRGHDKVCNSYHQLASCCHGHDPLHEENLDEKTFKLNPAKKGMFKGKSISDIRKSEKHDTGTKKKEDVFAINAKHHFQKEEKVISEPTNPKIDKKIGSQKFAAGKKPVQKTPHQDCPVKEDLSGSVVPSMPFGSGDGSLARLRTMVAKRNELDARIGSVPRGAGKPLVTDTAKPEGKIGSCEFGAGKTSSKENPPADAKIGSTPFGAGTTLKHKAPGQNEDEQLDELSDKKLTQYGDKSSMAMYAAADHKTKNKRFSGFKQANEKLAKRHGWSHVETVKQKNRTEETVVEDKPVFGNKSEPKNKPGEKKSLLAKKSTKFESQGSSPPIEGISSETEPKGDTLVELSKKVLSNYREGARGQRDVIAQAHRAKSLGTPLSKKDDKVLDKRKSGIAAANKKLGEDEQPVSKKPSIVELANSVLKGK